MPDEIYVDPNAGSASRILVDGVWYVRAGASDEDPTVGDEDIETQSCDACTAQYPGMVYACVANNHTAFAYPFSVATV